MADPLLNTEKKMVNSSMDSLLDGILINILSFLPMKQAASTSVLSRRWRTLFAHTHNLNFDDPFVNMTEDERRESGKILGEFVDRTFALQVHSQCKKLSLTLKYSRDHRSIRDWICYALEHGVPELHLCITNEMSFLSRVFTSTTLSKLSLASDSYFCIEFPSDTSLPSLKVLLLDEIAFRRDQLSDVLLPACPVLEDFSVHHLEEREYEDQLRRSNPEYSHAITSKTIKNLCYSGKPLFKYYQFDLLVKARLDLDFCFNEIIKQNVAKLICGISNVKILHLSIWAVKMIAISCKDELPVFKNLVHLVFSSYEEGLRVLLPCLLQRSPNLKVLVLSVKYCRFQTPFVAIQIPLENQIEKLSIRQYQGSVNELRHISHCLLNMKCLKVVRVDVAAAMDESKKMQLMEDLIKLPTASTASSDELFHF